MRRILGRYWWVMFGGAGLCAGVVLFAVVSAGQWRVQREALLNDAQQLRSGAVRMNRYQRRQTWERFADTLQAGLKGGLIDDRNRTLARYLAADARLTAGEESLAHLTEIDEVDPRRWAECLELYEKALSDPALYTDFRDPGVLEPEEAPRLIKRLGEVPTREKLIAQVTDARLRAADRLARGGDTAAAWKHWKLLTAPQQCKSGDELLLHVPSLAQRALAERAEGIGAGKTEYPLGAKLAAEIARAGGEGAQAVAMIDELSGHLREAPVQPLEAADDATLAPALLLGDLYVAAAQAARLAGETGKAAELLAAVEEPGKAIGVARIAEIADAMSARNDPALPAARIALRALQNAQFTRAEMLRDEALSKLASLAGPQRPLPGEMLELAIDDYTTAYTEAQRAYEPLGALNDPRLRDRALLAGAGLLLDDARYHWQYLPSLDPDQLAEFRTPDEDVAEARLRLAAGPSRELLEQIRTPLEEIMNRARFSDDPDLWVAARLRLGQLNEVTPIEGMRARLGRMDTAVENHYLPLLTARELRGDGARALIVNPHVPWRRFFEAWVGSLLHTLSLRPADSTETAEVLEQLGDPALHAEMFHAARRLDPKLTDAGARVAELLRRTAELRRYAGLPEEGSRELYAKAANANLKLLADAGEQAPGAAVWLRAGRDLLASGNALDAAMALQRGLEQRESERDGPPTPDDMQCALDLGTALETLGALQSDRRLGGAIPVYRWIVERVLPGLQARGALPPAALPAFLGLGRAQYRLGMRHGDADLLRAAIKDLEAHLVHATVFPAPPLDLEFSPVRMQAQLIRGRCAVELARMERLKEPPDADAFRARLALARESLDDVVQRFNDQPLPEVREAQLLLARTDFMEGLYDSAPLAQPSLDALERAAARLQGLRLEVDASPKDELRRLCLLLQADTLELLGRRYDTLAQDGDAGAIQPARRRLQEAIRACEALDRDFPHLPSVAPALLHRVSCYQLLGRAAPADLQQAQRLLQTAEAVLARVPDAAWQTEPQGMRRQYWVDYFRWMSRMEAP
jgi:tetratricopeptide (TPR) repeat protein